MFGSDVVSDHTQILLKHLASKQSSIRNDIYSADRTISFHGDFNNNFLKVSDESDVTQRAGVGVSWRRSTNSFVVFTRRKNS